jgi:hypothetical protein
MPVITTSVSVNAISTRALTISTNGNYLVTATTFLESQSSYAVGIDPAIGAVTFNLAGSVVANLSYYGIYQTGATDPLTINVLASGSIFGGGVVFSNSQLTLTAICMAKIPEFGRGSPMILSLTGAKSMADPALPSRWRVARMCSQTRAM